MASTVKWVIAPVNQWMSDNLEGEQHYFDNEALAIQSACDMEKNKPNPEYVLVYRRDGPGIKSKIPV